MTNTIEIPWTDDSAWGKVTFEPFSEDQDTGQVPDGLERLFNLLDASPFTDRAGHHFSKVADGPVQGAVVVTDSEGTFAQLHGSCIVRYG